MGWQSSVQYFSPKKDVALHDPSGLLMNTSLMLLLDAARTEVGRPFTITSGFRSPEQQQALIDAGKTETTSSAHSLGEAVDGCFKDLPILFSFLYLIRFPFSGIGIYPYTIPAVVHVDVHDRGEVRKALWVVDENSKYFYAPSDEFYQAWLKWRKL